MNITPPDVERVSCQSCSGPYNSSGCLYCGLSFSDAYVHDFGLELYEVIFREGARVDYQYRVSWMCGNKPFRRLLNNYRDSLT